MSSIVLDLQNEVSTPNCDIVNILRKAHIIAVKLKLNEFDQWICYELNGYPNQASIPDYRKVRGELKALNPYQGWIPVMITNADIENLLCEKKINSSISEIVSLCEKSNKNFIGSFAGPIMEQINDMFDPSLPMEYALHMSNASVKDIIEKVKNTVLEWTLRLESEGIVGENMTFTKIESESAKSIPQQVNYYGTVVNGNVSDSQVVSGDNNTVIFNYEKALCALSEIRNSIETEKIDVSDKELAIELLEEISKKIEDKKKPGIIKSAFIGLKDFLIDIGAIITATLIVAKIQDLF